MRGHDIHDRIYMSQPWQCARDIGRRRDGHTRMYKRQLNVSVASGYQRKLRHHGAVVAHIQLTRNGLACQHLDWPAHMPTRDTEP